VLGLDPDPARLWPRATKLADRTRPSDDVRERTARAVAAHCALAIEATAEHCLAVKPQVASFERLGAAGWNALEEVARRSREHGLLVIMDAKRGDIDVTAEAYAQAYFGQSATPYGPVPSLEADALTINPLLGTDSMLPLVRRARETGGGVFVLIRTSNPGAADVQGLRLADGRQTSDHLAEIAVALGAVGVGASGLSDVGAVVGATAPEWVARLREQMPNTIFLLPGVGAQRGEVADLGPAFAPGPAGGLITVSRGILAAHERIGGEPSAAARAEAARLREQVWQLAA
jgi:orotidine-5'-phosphate decarboxylase